MKKYSNNRKSKTERRKKSWKWLNKVVKGLAVYWSGKNVNYGKNGQFSEKKNIIMRL